MVSFNDAELRAIVQKAIFDGLTHEKRDELLIKAIGSLTIPDPNGYGAVKQSQLERIFESAAGRVAEELMLEMLQQPEWKERIRAVLVDAFDRATADASRENLVSKLSRAMAAALGER